MLYKNYCDNKTIIISSHYFVSVLRTRRIPLPIVFEIVD